MTAIDVALPMSDVRVGKPVRSYEWERTLELMRVRFGTVNVAYGYTLVGHGEVTNPRKCGKHFTFYGCLRTDLHNMTTLDGENYAGRVFTRKVLHWCNRASCPVCFKHGWAKREAGRIEARLVEASKTWGQIEHICASVPPRDYGLSLEALRKKVTKLLKRRGVIGVLLSGIRTGIDLKICS